MLCTKPLLNLQAAIDVLATSGNITHLGVSGQMMNVQGHNPLAGGYAHQEGWADQYAHGRQVLRHGRLA